MALRKWIDMSERDEKEGMTEKEKCPRKYITVETEEKKKTPRKAQDKFGTKRRVCLMWSELHSTTIPKIIITILPEGLPFIEWFMSHRLYLVFTISHTELAVQISQRSSGAEDLTNVNSTRKEPVHTQKNGRNREEKSGEEVKMQHKTETLEQNQARHSLFWCQSSSSQGVLGRLTQNGLTADALWSHSRGHKWEVYVWKTKAKWKQAFADSQWKLQATQPPGEQQLIEKLLCIFP